MNVVPLALQEGPELPQGGLHRLGSGQQYRDFIYVDDIVAALLALHRNGLNKGVIQVGNGKAVTIASAAEVRQQLCASSV